VLVTVIVITSCSTFVMGILPTWHQVGILARCCWSSPVWCRALPLAVKVLASLPIWPKALNPAVAPR
jgi:hypothetical protein